MSVLINQNTMRIHRLNGLICIFSLYAIAWRNRFFVTVMLAVALKNPALLQARAGALWVSCLLKH